MKHENRLKQYLFILVCEIGINLWEIMHWANLIVRVRLFLELFPKIVHSVEHFYPSGLRRMDSFKIEFLAVNFFICPPSELLPVLGPLEWWRDAYTWTALLCSSKGGFWSGSCVWIGLRSFVNWVSLMRLSQSLIASACVKCYCYFLNAISVLSKAKKRLKYNFDQMTLCATMNDKF